MDDVYDKSYSMSAPIKTVPAGQFKQTCLRLLDEVAETGQPILVTKRGRPVAQLVPAPGGEDRAAWIDSLRGSVRTVGDVVSPAADIEEWEALG